jgi:hypothetical protein
VCNQWQFTPLIRGDQIGLRHVMFAVLLPMFPFVLWHGELVFNLCLPKTPSDSSRAASARV